MTRACAEARADRDTYHLLAAEAIHALHEQHVELARLRARHGRLAEEYRALRASTCTSMTCGTRPVSAARERLASPPCAAHARAAEPGDTTKRRSRAWRRACDGSTTSSRVAKLLQTSRPSSACLQRRPRGSRSTSCKLSRRRPHVPVAQMDRAR